MDVDMVSTCRAARWRWLRRLQPNPVWDSLDLARLARHPLNDTSPETPPCNHHSNFSETETYFHAARHSSFLTQSINTTSCKATLAATTLLSPLLAARRCKGPRRASRCLLMRRVVKSPAFAAFAASFTAAEARRTVAEPHPVSRTKARSFAYA